MDDFTLFGDDRGMLAEAREAIREWLAEQRGLRLKDPEVLPRPTTQEG